MGRSRPTPGTSSPTPALPTCVAWWSRGGPDPRDWGRVSDYHLRRHAHVGFDGDATGQPRGRYPPGHIEAYVETAAARGVTERGFTEHLYRCKEAAPVLGRFWEAPGTPDDEAELTRARVEA